MARSSLVRRDGRRHVARAPLTGERAVDVLAAREAELDEDRAERHRLTLTQPLLGQRALELCGLDDTRVDEEQPQAGFGRRLFENDLQHPHQVERAERLHDVRGRADGARERAAFWIVARGEHHDADAARRGGAPDLTAHDETIARASLEGDVQEDDLGLFAARRGERFVGRRGLEHSPALRNERDPHERADGSVVVRDQDRRNALRRGRSLIAHSATLRLWQTIGQA